MDRKNGTPRGIRQIPVLAGQIIERTRLGLRSPWLVIPVCTFAFTHQPDSQAEEYTWKDGAVLWSNEAASWTVDETSSAWPANTLNADALFMTGDETITLGSDVLVNDIELDPNAGNVSISGTPTFVLAGDILPTIEIAAGRSLTVNSTVIADAGFTKTGTGTLTLSSNLSRLADVTVNSGILQIGSPTATGGNLALRRSDLSVASGASVLSVGTVGTARDFDLWTGSLSGAGTISTKSATTTTTGALNLSALKDATFSGSVTASNLLIQGPATQTFDGSISGVSGSVIISTGSTVKLQGTGSNVGAFGRADIHLRGGKLVLDNTTGDLSGIVAAGRVDGNVHSFGGALSLIGDSNGTHEGFGTLHLFSGATKLSGQHGSAGTTLTSFEEIAISSASRATIDFTRSGETASISINKASSSPLGPWATVDNDDFAAYSGTTVVKYTYATNAIFTDVLGSSPSAANYATLNQSVSTITKSNFDFNARGLRIAPTANHQTLTLASNRNLNVGGILLSGPHDYSISNMAGSTGGIATPTNATTGADIIAPRYIGVAQKDSMLTLGIPLKKPGLDIVKHGAGFLSLTADNSATLNSGNTAFVINEGTLRASVGTSLPTNGFSSVRLRGGVLELSNASDSPAGDFTFALGTTEGTVNWTGGLIGTTGVTDQGGGGFSAHGGNATVNIGGSPTPSPLVWSSGGFISDGFNLEFGSTRSDSRITVLNSIALDSGSSSTAYNLRTFRVADNPGSATDVARLAGNISGSPNSDFLKTGAGRLEVTGDNNYTGQTIIHSGELQIGANDGTGAGNGRLSGTERIVVNQSGSLLLGGQNSFTDRISDSTAVSLDGGKLVTDGFSEYSGSAGAIQPGVGSLTLLSDSLIDFGGGASIFAFSDSSHTTWTGTLKIYNYGQGDQLFFGTTSSGLTAAQLARISFYADAGNISLGAPSMRGDGGISVVPEPSSGLTAAALTIFLGSRHRGRRRRS